jgi:hypothetical protein
LINAFEQFNGKLIMKLSLGAILIGISHLTHSTSGVGLVERMESG